MRIVAEIPHPEFKITVFSWNAKFIVKVEAGMFEQVFRISEESVDGDLEKVKLMVNTEFINNCLPRFVSMRDDYTNSIKKINQAQL